MQAKEIKKDIYDIDALIDERFGKEHQSELKRKNAPILFIQAR